MIADENYFFSAQDADSEGTEGLFFTFTKEEFENGSAKDSINIPLDEIIKGHFPDVSKDTSIEVFCESGARASFAVSILKQNGFINSKNILQI
jgi:rhodanese-related sulfurtransferase